MRNRPISEPAVRPTQRQTRLDEAQRAELIHRYSTGERAFELATLFGIARSTAAQILEEAGVKRPRSMTSTEIGHRYDGRTTIASASASGERKQESSYASALRRRP
jgi:hypothetical protein